MDERLLGPEIPERRPWSYARFAVHTIIFVCLTALTQIGGVLWLLAIEVGRYMAIRSRSLRILLFLGIYAAGTVCAHQLAPLLGRVPLGCLTAGESSLVVRSPLFCVLNRNYATPHLRSVALALARHMNENYPGTTTLVLDANFPFFDGFPLLPHLSHDDGRKLDVAFYYRDRQGRFRNGETRSPIGYFAFEQPEPASPLPCADRHRWPTFRWDLAFLQPLFPDWHVEDRRMREALNWLSTDGKLLGVDKVFVEPHIASRLGIANDTIRFQGCRAARHDDHIHIQVAS